MALLRIWSRSMGQTRLPSIVPGLPGGPRLDRGDINAHSEQDALDVSLFFGRYVPVPNEKGEQTLVELCEHQIYMTLEQAEDLVKILNQTVEVTKARKRPETQGPKSDTNFHGGKRHDEA